MSIGRDVGPGNTDTRHLLSLYTDTNSFHHNPHANAPRARAPLREAERVPRQPYPRVRAAMHEQQLPLPTVNCLFGPLAYLVLLLLLPRETPSQDRAPAPTPGVDRGLRADELPPSLPRAFSPGSFRDISRLGLSARAPREEGGAVPAGARAGEATSMRRGAVGRVRMRWRGPVAEAASCAVPSACGCEVQRPSRNPGGVPSPSFG